MFRRDGPRFPPGTGLVPEQNFIIPAYIPLYIFVGSAARSTAKPRCLPCDLVNFAFGTMVPEHLTSFSKGEMETSVGGQTPQKPTTAPPQDIVRTDTKSGHHTGIIWTSYRAPCGHHADITCGHNKSPPSGGGQASNVEHTQLVQAPTSDLTTSACTVYSLKFTVLNKQPTDTNTPL